MNNCIKVVNPEAAKKLVASGFSYIKEQIGERVVFTFAWSRGLGDILTKDFTCNDYFSENKLRF